MGCFLSFRSMHHFILLGFWAQVYLVWRGIFHGAMVDSPRLLSGCDVPTQANYLVFNLSDLNFHLQAKQLVLSCLLTPVLAQKFSL